MNENSFTFRVKSLFEIKFINENEHHKRISHIQLIANKGV